MKTILVTQARMGSTRLPGKVLKKVDGSSLLRIHLDRLNKCKNISGIIVATTNTAKDDILYDLVVKWGYTAYRGQETDVLDRYYNAVEDHQPDWIVRVTSDCPLIDSGLIDEVIRYVQQEGVDYGSNALLDLYPDGQDVEIMRFAALEKAWKESVLLSEREHVSPYIRKNSNNHGKRLFSAINYPRDSDFSKIRMTVDEPEDLVVIEELINALGIDATWREYTNYYIKNGLDKINGNNIRNEGYLKSLKKD
mgnify:CR=1 FL=1